MFFLDEAKLSQRRRNCTAGHPCEITSSKSVLYFFDRNSIIPINFISTAIVADEGQIRPGFVFWPLMSPWMTFEKRQNFEKWRPGLLGGLLEKGYMNALICIFFTHTGRILCLGFDNYCAEQWLLDSLVPFSLTYIQVMDFSNAILILVVPGMLHWKIGYKPQVFSFRVFELFINVAFTEGCKNVPTCRSELTSASGWIYGEPIWTNMANEDLAPRFLRYRALALRLWPLF